MELGEYLKIFKTYRKTIIGFTIIGILLALIWSVIGYRGFTGYLSLIIRPAFPQQTADFQYNGYYSLEASDRVTRMTEQWIKQQNFPLTLRRLGNQYLQITFKEESQEDVKQTSEIIQKQIELFLHSLTKYPQNSFEAVTVNFSSKKQTPPIRIVLILGFLGGLFFGVFSALFKHYVRQVR